MDETQAPLTHTLAQRNTREDISLPAIQVADLGGPHELILADSRQQDSPDQPINTTSREDAESDDAVQIVRQVVVDALAILWRDERGCDEVDVAEEEQQCRRDCGAEWWIPLVACWVPVDPEETAGDEDVDD